MAVSLAVSLQPVGSAAAQSSAAQDSFHSISIAAYVSEASQRFGIPKHWIYAVIRAESAGQVKAKSHAGAMGLMQIMPGTWAILRARYQLGADPYDPRDNIHAGTAYLREMVDQFGVPGFLAAYNAGPGRYRQHASGGRPLPRETRAYVAKIMPEIVGGSSHFPAANPGSQTAIPARAVRVHWTRTALFAARGDPISRAADAVDKGLDRVASASDPDLSDTPSQGLFAPISAQIPE